LTQVHEILAAYDNDCDAAVAAGEDGVEIVSYDDLTFDPGAEHY
jgi:hypothetical protein